MFQSLKRFISQLNQGIQVPPFLSIIIETLSSLQIFHIIFKTISYFSNDDHIITRMLSKNIQFFTAGFTLTPPFEFPAIIHPIWYILALYLALFLFLLISLATYSFRNKNFNQSVKKVSELIGIAHSRVFFFPIQFFFFGLIRLYKDKSCNLNNEFYCKSGWFLGTIGLCLVNFLLALIKELVFYQTAKTKDFYAVKTNLYHQAVLVHKMLVLGVLLLNENSDTAITVSSVFHVIFTMGLLYILYTRLPFYRFRILKITVMASAISFCLSVLSLLQACIKNNDFRESTQVILLLLPPLGVKLALSIFKSLFEKILQNKNPSPAYAIHFSLLLKQLTKKENVSFFIRQGFFPRSRKIFWCS